MLLDFFQNARAFLIGSKKDFKVIMAGFKFLRERKDEWLIRVQGGEAKGETSTDLLFLLYSQKSVSDLPMFVFDLPMFVSDLPKIQR